ncbi:hypothetical protein F5888DRAFT_1701561 [Russula emetica]|nr:hypothetical protein F5888DRAFT_1701561 [Russula emetica]
MEMLRVWISGLWPAPSMWPPRFYTHRYSTKDMSCVILLLLVWSPPRQWLSRSSWPWGLGNLLAPPQLESLELVPARTGKAVGCQYICCDLCMSNRLCHTTR